MRFVLDTDHVSLIQSQSQPEFSAISARLAGCSSGDLSHTIVSLHEQLVGCQAFMARARTPEDAVRGYEKLQRVLETFMAFPVLPFDAGAAAEFTRLRAARIRIGTMDLRIASIVRSRGLILLTRNTRDFGRVPGLLTQDWTV